MSLTYIWISVASHFTENKVLGVTCPPRHWTIQPLQYFPLSSSSLPSLLSQQYMLWLMIKVSEIKFNLHSQASKAFYDLASVYSWLPCKQPKPQPHLVTGRSWPTLMASGTSLLLFSGTLLPPTFPVWLSGFKLHLYSLTTWWPSIRDISEPTFLIYKTSLITATTLQNCCED